jgi:hypothetical protein
MCSFGSGNRCGDRVSCLHGECQEPAILLDPGREYVDEALTGRIRRIRQLSDHAPAPRRLPKDQADQKCQSSFSRTAARRHRPPSFDRGGRFAYAPLVSQQTCCRPRWGELCNVRPSLHQAYQECCHVGGTRYAKVAPYVHVSFVLHVVGTPKDRVGL